MSKVYVVTSVDHGGYDSWDVSYHLTKRGAMKFIINSHYANWSTYRYVKSGGYEDLHLYFTEYELNE